MLLTVIKLPNILRKWTCRKGITFRVQRLMVRRWNQYWYADDVFFFMFGQHLIKKSHMWGNNLTLGDVSVSLNLTLQFSVRVFDMLVHKCMRRWVGHAARQWASPSMSQRFGFVPLFQRLPRAWLQLVSSMELFFCHFFLSPLQAGETLTRKVKSAWAVVRFNPPNSWRHAFFKHFWALKEGVGGERRELCTFVCP